jgi:hypothetical protein
MQRFLNTDSILGTVFIVLGSVLLYLSVGAEKTAFFLPGDISPYLVPQVYLYLWIAISVIILVNGVLGAGKPLPAVHKTRLVGVIAALVFGAVSMSYIGFLISAPITVFGICWLLGYRHFWKLSAIAIFSVLAIWLLLAKLAHMPLPPVPGLGI